MITLLLRGFLQQWWVIGTILVMTASVQSLTFRPATAQDVFQARKILLQQLMNPLSLSQERLLVVASSSDDLLGFGQIRPLESLDFSELASLFVDPEYRREGIGSALVQELLDRHDSTTPQQSVCLLTLAPTVPFYTPFGFQTISKQDMTSQNIPSSLQLEYVAGEAISSFLGNQLVCMVRPPLVA